MIFVSYKSDDANLVRHIAHALLGTGNPIWFAEYKVLLGNYDIFQDAIDEGIAQSKHAIFFTNRQWSLSEHCLYERVNLLKKIPPENCCEIVLNETSRYLGDFFENVIYVSGGEAHSIFNHVNYILKFLLEAFGLRSTHLLTFPLGNTIFLPYMGIQLRTGPLLPRIKDNQFLSQNFMSPIVLFKNEFPEGTVGLNLQVMPFDSVLSSISSRYGEIQDDRKLYKEYIAYANNWISSYHKNTSNRSNSVMQPLGLHLFFKNNRSNFALTYFSRSKSNNEIITIEHRYIIPLEGSLVEEKGEIGIVFYGQFKGSLLEQLTMFNKYSIFFEEVVESLIYNTPSGRTARVNDLPIYLSKMTFAGVTVFFTNYCFGQEEPIYASLLAFASGVVIRDIIEFSRLKIYKRLLWMMNPIEDNLNKTEYEQISSTFYIQLYTNVLLLGYGFITAMKSVHKSVPDILLWMIFSAELLLKTSIPITKDWFNYFTVFTGLITGLSFGKLISTSIINQFTRK